MKRNKKVPDVEVADFVASASTSKNECTIAYLAEQYGKDPRLVYQRIRKGWTIERALTEPSRAVSATTALARIASERGVTVESLIAGLLKKAQSKQRKVS